MQNSIVFTQCVDNEDNLNSVSNDLLDDLVEEVLIGVYFDVHRAAKHTKSLFVDESTAEEIDKYDKKGTDIFGELPVKKQHECECPNCHRNLAASRFAPHLEKCMGMGRNSSRIASKRIANTSMKNNDSDADEYDNNADTDWNANGGDKPTKKRTKRLKNGNNGIGNGIHKRVYNSKQNKSGLSSSK
ncbi:SAGA-associated factor 11 homolog isoform X2 [Oppia nitens]|uniref:SAGA-associated factor 11 homolog isoform X2 n=1 Tax=Oppia nitens TaxID=1686743 RepID=UPI0023DB32DA|nr:SAGA-associated factor 11 homolog isoform X2 [Oppia nitens]